MHIGRNQQAKLARQIKNKQSPHTDTLYGLHTVDNKLYLDNESMKVKGRDGDKEYSYFVKGKEFPVSDGLTTLLMHNNPDHYNEKELRLYKEMLEVTSAHKNSYRENGRIIRQAGKTKYDTIVTGLFPEKKRGGRDVTTQMNFHRGGSMKKPQMNYKSVNKAGKINHTYWDGPNELVDRLHILMLSKSVGLTGHDNEIISITEELREAKIIK